MPYLGCQNSVQALEDFQAIGCALEVGIWALSEYPGPHQTLDSPRAPSVCANLGTG
jgi:hypothetical protein